MKCEDLRLIQEWFTQFSKIRDKYKILKEDIYNIDKIGFKINIIFVIKVICGLEI